MDKNLVFGAVIVAVFLCTVCIWGGMWIYMRRKYVAFTEDICQCIDQILQGQGTEGFIIDDETLLSKIQLRLKWLSDITEAAAEESEEQKKQVQSIVSDISHQLKTPIANITMYCDTAMRPEISGETRQECLKVLEKQVKRLDSLIQSLLQMSRLENNIISLLPEKNNVRDMLYEVIESIRVAAEKKNLALQLECPEKLNLYYDEKWTSEAIFNIVDNSIKYTQDGGKIRIAVEKLDIYTKIVIQDSGIGISPEHINDVCKRFFREEKIRGAEGVGIGLYLTREIITKQNGYLKINSQEGKGTQVSVYLLNEPAVSIKTGQI